MYGLRGLQLVHELFFVFFFFFSSRRRHTRLQGDWSSDVCSSDLLLSIRAFSGAQRPLQRERILRRRRRPQYQLLSRKLLSRSERDGWRSLRNAFASICRMRSRVTSNCLPTSSSVWSVFISMPKRMRSTLASRGVRESRTSLVTSRKDAYIAASFGASVAWSSMKSPRCESSSSPIGVSIEIGSFEILRILRILSSGISIFWASVAGSGSCPVSWRI